MQVVINCNNYTSWFDAKMVSWVVKRNEQMNFFDTSGLHTLEVISIVGKCMLAL